MTPNVVPTTTSAAPLFELLCAEVHPVRCDVRLRSASPQQLVRLACAHGAEAHGFTPAWYSSKRLAAMAKLVSGHHGVCSGGPAR